MMDSATKQTTVDIPNNTRTEGMEGCGVVVSTSGVPREWVTGGSGKRQLSKLLYHTIIVFKKVEVIQLLTIAACCYVD